MLFTRIKNTHTGNSCYEEGSPIFNYMYTEGCTTCELCPGGSVTAPNATVDYFGGLGYYNLQCYQIEYAIGNNRFLTEENCTLSQTGLAGVCCGVGPATLGPEFSIPDEPSSAPPGTSPTPGTADASGGAGIVGSTTAATTALTLTASITVMSGIAAAVAGGAAAAVW